MTALAAILKDYGRRPVELYHFVIAGQDHYLTPHWNGYTTTTPAATWLHEPGLSHGEIRHTGNLNQQLVDVTFPASSPFAQAFLDPYYAMAAELTIMQVDEADPDQELIYDFRGGIYARPRGQGRIKLQFADELISFKRKALVKVIQGPCDHALYDQATCGLNIATYQVTGTITAVDSATSTLTITEAALAPDGDYDSGFLTYQGIHWQIESHTGDQVEMFNMPDVVLQMIADEITANGSDTSLIAPGCNRTTTRCNSRFNNIDNNGGFPFATESLYKPGKAVV